MTSPMPATSSIRFQGLIAPEEQPTGDGRIFARASLGHRRLPAPGMFSRSLTDRHGGAVAVARLEQVEYLPGEGWRGRGAFLDPRIVPEVTEAIYLAQQGISRPSVDLEPDLTYELAPHPGGPDRIPQRRILNGRIMGFTLVPYTAFDQVNTEVLVAGATWQITVGDQGDANALLAAGVDLQYVNHTFTVNTGSWRSMPIASRETVFNFREATNRLVEWSGGQPSRFSRAFLWRDPQGDPSQRTTYRLPIADIIDGRLTMVPRAVFSAATFLSGGHGFIQAISEAERSRLQVVVTRIYEKLSEQFNDPRIRPPWQRGGRAGRDSAASIMIPQGGE